MVVVAAFGAALRVASGPHARVHSVDGRRRCAPRERMADEQLAQELRVDASTGQSRVEVAPSAPVGGFLRTPLRRSSQSIYSRKFAVAISAGPVGA
jgi:hypothetical protein